MSPIALPIAELKSALAGLGKVIPKRATLPILGTVRIERTKDGWIALTGTDLSNHVTVRLEQPVAGEPASLLVPFDELIKTCKACGGGGEVTVERSDDISALLQYRIGAQFVETKVESLPVAEFSDIPRFKADAIAIPDSLRDSIHQALQCASTDPTRLILNGACIDASKPEANYVVGTDGHHLFSSNSFTLPLPQSLIIPTHKFIAWREFNNDGEWQLKVMHNEHGDTPEHLQISSRRWRFIACQIEGNYPNWRQVIPDENSFTTSILFADPAALADTIQRLPDHDEKDHTIGIERAGNTVHLLWKPDRTQPWNRLEVDHDRLKGAETKTYLNRHYLIKALRFGLRRLQLTDAVSPIRFSEEGRQMIIMPVRAEAPSEPAAANATTATAEEAPASNSDNPPPEAEQPTDKPMPDTNGADQSAPKTTTATTTETTEKSALENALTQLETVRGEFRNALASLHKFGDLLKQAQKEHKASEKEISSVRTTLRSLQTVRI